MGFLRGVAVTAPEEGRETGSVAGVLVPPRLFVHTVLQGPRQTLAASDPPPLRLPLLPQGPDVLEVVVEGDAQAGVVDLASEDVVGVGAGAVLGPGEALLGVHEGAAPEGEVGLVRARDVPGREGAEGRLVEAETEVRKGLGPLRVRPAFSNRSTGAREPDRNRQPSRNPTGRTGRTGDSSEVPVETIRR